MRICLNRDLDSECVDILISLPDMARDHAVNQLLQQDSDKIRNKSAYLMAIINKVSVASVLSIFYFFVFWARQSGDKMLTNQEMRGHIICW